jgi:pimeloyl-ACP methyl ester carboxylesterase
MSPDPFEVDNALPRNNHIVLHEGTVELLGGGSAAWCEWGDPRGRPVCFLHGTPGSRLFLPEAKQRLGSGARVLTVDRPGYGRSTSLAIPSLAVVAEIVAAIADALGLDRFPVVGFSGGGPFALACGAFLPERVSRVAMVSSWGPLDELEAAYASLTPTERELVAAIRADPAGATTLLWESGAWYAERPLRFLETPHEPVDEPILRESTIRANFSASNLEGARRAKLGLWRTGLPMLCRGASLWPTSASRLICGSANAIRAARPSMRTNSSAVSHRQLCTQTQRRGIGCSFRVGPRSSHRVCLTSSQRTYNRRLAWASVPECPPARRADWYRR